MNNNLKRYLIYLLIPFFFYQKGKAQSTEVSDQNYFKRYLSTLTCGGYYRGYLYERKMSTPYGNLGQNKMLSIQDPAYWDPMLYLYFAGNVTPSTTVGADLNLVNLMMGPARANTNVLNNYNAVQLWGNTEIKNVGKFYVTFGGIEWTKISTFTFGGNVGYNRYSTFERRPFDDGGNVKSRYASYYYQGSFHQDVRFGSNAFKGIILKGLLAKNMSFDFYYGKPATIGGYLRPDQVTPKHDVALKVTKTIKNGSVSFNTYNSTIILDSINASKHTPTRFNMATVSEILKFNGIGIISELGVGGNEDRINKRAWSPAFITDISIPEEISKIPISLRYYHIGKNFINNNSNVSNTSVTQVTNISQITSGFSGSQGAGTLLPAGLQMTGVGSLVNNRTGGNINTEIKLGKLKIQIGNEVSVDLNRIGKDTTISYGHRVNSLQWSKFVQFPNNYGNYGPNARVNSYYRGVYEVATIRDRNANNELRSKLAYNSCDVQLKWKQTIFGRDLYINNLNTFSSVGTNISPIPVFTDKSYLQAAFSEVDINYHIHNMVMLDFYLGYEHIKGNQYTAAAVPVTATTNVLKNRDQYGKAIGTGFDLALNKSTNIYFRYRWFEYHDKSTDTLKLAQQERFKGQEGTVEIKVYF